jgi:hypothetical protein
MHKLEVIAQKLLPLITCVIVVISFSTCVVSCVNRDSGCDYRKGCEQEAGYDTNDVCDTTKIVYNMNNTNNVNISIIEEEVNIDIKINK